jgi:hypothetical protein
MRPGANGGRPALTTAGGGIPTPEESRLLALEARLQAVEDQLAIIRLLNAYGPLVDSGSADAAAALWVAGGGYEFGLENGDVTRVAAPQELVTLYESEPHAGFVSTGVAHLTATPHVTVTGDTAEAVGYSFVILREADRWYVHRCAINHWSLARTPAGWRIRERRNRPLIGSSDSRELMRGLSA